mgnify:CR=1 FL=1
MEENDYSVVLENVKGENEVDDDYHYYDRNRFGKKYCIVIKRQLSDTKEWLVGQAVKTSPSHGENRGSIPLSAAYSLIE